LAVLHETLTPMEEPMTLDVPVGPKGVTPTETDLLTV